MQSNKKLHLVTFNIPYPPNYGGIIDVFYKIKQLHQLNIDIYLHCFEYDRPQQKELEKYCKKVFYYQRSSKIKSLFSQIPFIVKSRENCFLTDNLKKINAPIIFEGLHTTFPLLKTTFKANTFVRVHNIEHNYFKGLAKSESNLFKKIFFLLEASKLKRYQFILKNVSGIFSISPSEQKYFLTHFGKKSTYIPAFHHDKQIKIHKNNNNYILYHGDLRISDNIKAAKFLINVYKNSPYQLVIASSDFSSIEKLADKHQNIIFSKINNQQELENLFKKAHVNTLITFQNTGIKLKLLNALYQGKFIIGNSEMILDTGLETLCELANTKEEILEKTNYLFTKEFSEIEIDNRRDILKSFNPTESAKKMIAVIFKQ